MHELKALNRQKRGQVSTQEVKQYENASKEQLAFLLNNSDPQKRTIAAILIGTNKITELIPKLCQSITQEKSLYPRIAMSKALGKMGEPAVKPLIALLGKIGTNHERDLPKKYFNKKSFPLARDLAARTLVKIESPAIPSLIEKITNGDQFEIQQALDAVGGIVSRTNDRRPLPILLQALADYSANEITTWKIVRTLSAFKCMEAVEPLTKMLSHAKPSIRWEAARSIGLVGIVTKEVAQSLQSILNDENTEVRKAVKITLEELNI